MKLSAPVPFTVRWIVNFTFGAGLIKLFQFLNPLFFGEADIITFFAKAHYADLLMAVVVFVAIALFIARNRWSTSVLFWVVVFLATHDAFDLWPLFHQSATIFVFGSLQYVLLGSYFVGLISVIVALFSKSVSTYLGTTGTPSN